MTQFLFHTTVKWWVFFFKHIIHYTCISSHDVDTKCVLYYTLLYDHIVINVNAPLIGEIKYTMLSFQTIFCDHLLFG